MMRTRSSLVATPNASSETDYHTINLVHLAIFVIEEFVRRIELDIEYKQSLQKQRSAIHRTSLALLQASLAPWALLTSRPWTAGPSTTQKDHMMRKMDDRKRKSEIFWRKFKEIENEDHLTDQFIENYFDDFCLWLCYLLLFASLGNQSSNSKTVFCNPP